MLSDAGKNRIYIGKVDMNRNDNESTIVSWKSIDDDNVVNQDQVYAKKPPVDNIFLEFFVEDADNVKFITELLTKPSPMFKVEWTKNNATINSCFPFEP